MFNIQSSEYKNGRKTVSVKKNEVLKKKKRGPSMQLSQNCFDSSYQNKKSDKCSSLLKDLSKNGWNDKTLKGASMNLFTKKTYTNYERYTSQ